MLDDVLDPHLSYLMGWQIEQDMVRLSVLRQFHAGLKSSGQPWKAYLKSSLLAREIWSSLYILSSYCSDRVVNPLDLTHYPIQVVKQIKNSSSNLAFSADPAENQKAEEEIQKQNPVKRFTFRDIAAISRNLSPSRMIGEGGFGKVYNGSLQSGQNVAIKCLHDGSEQGKAEFICEVLMLGHLQHINLVRLVGYCIEGDQRILVYEFMPKGSLFLHLFEVGPKREALDWNTRMRIALGVAHGLEYLHHKASPPVIHRDIKAENILLDNDFCPKLSDFGLAKLGPVGDSSHISTRVMGTYGYCAPDYAGTGRLNVKSDIYSFGVVLLELITGRKAVDHTRPYIERELVKWACPLLRKKKMLQLADPLMKGCFPESCFENVAFVAGNCIKENPSHRPNITYVVEGLEVVVKKSEKWKIGQNISTSLSRG